MGTNGFQEPAVGLETTGPVAAGTSTGRPGEVLQGPAIEGARGKEPVQKNVPTQTGAPAPAAAGTERIIGTKRLYADGKFNSKDGKASFMETQWRGLQAEEGSRKEQVAVPDQQRPHQPCLAERPSGPTE
jgi:arsenite oxidase large subunit